MEPDEPTQPADEEARGPAALPWIARGVIAGASGTAAMTAAYALERRLRPSSKGPLDFDDSLVPGKIVAGLIRVSDASDDLDRIFGNVLRWGYGSVFGTLHAALRPRLGEPRATLAFGGTLMTATLTLFPLLGRTPPPWRWSRGFLLTSFGTHAVYALTVAAVDDRLAR